MRIAYLDCFSGISGDMFVAAVVDAGVPLTVLQEAVDSLQVGARLELKRVNRSGIDAAKIDVLTAAGTPAEVEHHEHAHEHVHPHAHDESHPDPHENAHGRSLAVIRQMIQGVALADGVKRFALSAFELLGAAEAKIHNVPLETIHFHEVGSVDAIADIVAAAAGVEWLARERQIERWFCSGLNVGGGHVHCTHGRFPVPAPATLELLRDLPIYSSGVQKELITPTGAAILRALDVVSAGFPAMRMEATGYGAGSRELPNQPNVLRVLLGESTAQTGSFATTREKIGILETTIDDATPELLSYVADRLLAAGASDVYRTPVQMKKGRSGTHLTVLCSPRRAPELQQLLFLESTTLGLRYREEEKFVLDRAVVAVETAWGKVRIKTGISAGTVVNAAPEFEDCKLLALKHSVPLKLIVQAAVAAYESARAGDAAEEKIMDESGRA